MNALARLVDRYPYGRAPFWLTLLAVLSTASIAMVSRQSEQARPDLTFALYAPNHLPAYRRVAAEFERRHHVRVGVQLVQQRALQTRLQNAMLAGTEVPDVVELPEGALGSFTRGPLADIGFVDLTERLEREGLRRRLVESRLSLWSTRGHVFALPHDVHPVMLAYRADLVEQLGIDVNQLDTWDKFVAAGQRVVADLDGDGVPDRYMLDLPASGGWAITLLLRQRGVTLFDREGRLSFNQPLTVDTLIWYLRQSFGPERIAFECGWGQPLVKAMSDGLALFYLTPDWRTFVIESDAPALSGKMKLMPLPAWEVGGRRTSVWGGTGLAITRASRKQELAWQFAELLYFNGPELGQRFAQTNIIPPFKDAWDLPEFHRKNPYFSGQAIGLLYAALAPSTPASWTTPYSAEAEAKLSEVFVRAAAHFRAHGESGLRAVVQRELDAAEASLQRAMERNVLATR